MNYPMSCHGAYDTVVGICICIPLIVFALLLRDTPLGREQSREDAEDLDAEKERLQNASFWQRLWS
jgi:SIT family siderophore-iron:H+ symporter-like MFS transporter